MTGTQDISPTTLRQALALWDDVPSLGRHPLAQLTVVAHKCRQSGHPPTAIGHGLALKELLLSALQQIRPDAGPPQPSERAWRPYLILQQRYCLGRIPDWIMLELSISSRTLYREMRHGLEQLATRLRHWEAEARASAIAPASDPEPPASRLPRLPLHPIIPRPTITMQLLAWLESGATRTISLIGLPGVGKTTAVLHLIHQPAVQTRFPDGIFWLGVGPHPDLFQILRNLAQQVGLPAERISRLATAHDLAGELRHQLQTKQCLFILDDIWQAEHARLLAVGGLQACHLLTSRQPEIATQLSGAYTLNLPELEPDQSRTLLADLAPQLDSEQIKRLHTLTGGLPLALLIAGKFLALQGHGGQHKRLAAGVAALEERATRLSLQLDLGLRASQTSLAAVIAQSLDELPPEAQRLLGDLPLFPPKPNDFGLEAVLALTHGERNAFFKLIDSGLVEPADSDRYTLHQAVHDFAATLETSAAAQVALVEHYARRSAAQPNGRYPFFEQEQANLEQALKLALADPDHSDALADLLFGMVPFLLDRGRQAEARQLTSQALKIPQLSATAQAKLGLCRGRIAQAANEISAALEAFSLSSTQAEAAGLASVALSGKVLTLRMLLRSGEHKAAQQIAGQIYHALEEEREPGWRADAHLALSAASYYRSDYRTAFEHAQTARALFEQLPEKSGLANVLQNLGVFSVELGRTEEALLYYDLARERYRQGVNRFREAQIEMNLGVAKVDIGQWQQAEQHYQRALELQEDLQNPDILQQTLLNLAVLYLAQHDLARAEATLARGFALCADQRYLFRQGKYLVSYAVLYTLQEDWETAVAHAARAIAIGEQIDNGQLIGEAASQQGIALVYQRKYAAALDPLQRAAAIWAAQEQQQGLAECDVYLGWANLQLGEISRAEQHTAAAAQAFGQQVNGLHDIVELLNIGGWLAEQLGDSAQAAALREKGSVLYRQQLAQISAAAAQARYQRRFERWASQERASD